VSSADTGGGDNDDDDNGVAVFLRTNAVPPECRRAHTEVDTNKAHRSGGKAEEAIEAWIFIVAVGLWRCFVLPA